LDVYGRLYGLTHAQRVDRIKEYLTLFDMWRFRGRPAGLLSEGETTRLMLAKAFLSHPKIVLLDEPTSALDQKAKKMVENIIEKINIEKSVAVVMVTHIGFSPEKINPRKFILSDGNLKKEGINEYS